MKRISLCVALLALTPGITEAYGYGSYYEGVHYSPYALSYYHSGLVGGGVYHSPYAVSYGGAGLVYGCVQYTPYAFNYYNSGLVANYGVYPGYSDYAFPVFRAFHRRPSPAVHRAPPVVRRHAQDAPCTAPPRDGMNIIRQHLQAKGLASVNIDRILRVDNQLVSVDVLVKDRNLLIKYWNPQEVERLNATESFQQKAYAKYKQDWERFAEQYKQTGGEIYYVNASEPQTIVAALDSCSKLGPGNDAQTPSLYAKD